MALSHSNKTNVNSNGIQRPSTSDTASVVSTAPKAPPPPVPPKKSSHYFQTSQSKTEEAVPIEEPVNIAQDQETSNSEDLTIPQVVIATC